MSKKIIILGAGIGGLTVAHELVRAASESYEIHFYERHAVIGGMARSGYKNRQGLNLPTEYCWRIYGPNYYNLREILKQIPLNNNSGLYVYDNLVDVIEYLIGDKQDILKMNNKLTTLFDLRRAFNNVPFKQKYQVVRDILYCCMISTNRLNNLDRLSWNEYINPGNYLCHDMKKYIVDIMGPYLGAEPLKVNVPSVVKTLESFKILNKPISVMNAPTNEAWFDHWKTYLEKNGVVFHFNSIISDIEICNHRVKAITLSDNTQVTGDLFFCDLPVESVAAMKSFTLPGINTLAKNAYQRMVGVQLYFDKKISLPRQNTAMYIPDSPWQLVIEPQGSIWGKCYGDVADFWSVGLCDPVQIGLLIKKPFIQCSPEEIHQEVWYQINNSEFGSFLNLSHVKVLDFNLWNSYIFNGQELLTDEPKFSTNKNTYFLRPNNKTPFNNFYFATAYTKTETDMFEMESAAESGRNAARIIEKSVRVVPNPRPLFFSPYRIIDKILSKFNLYKTAPFLFFALGLPLLLFLPFVYLYQLFTQKFSLKS